RDERSERAREDRGEPHGQARFAERLHGRVEGQVVERALALHGRGAVSRFAEAVAARAPDRGGLVDPELALVAARAQEQREEEHAEDRHEALHAGAFAFRPATRLTTSSTSAAQAARPDQVPGGRRSPLKVEESGMPFSRKLPYS